jgi:hypothetical protein
LFLPYEDKIDTHKKCTDGKDPKDIFLRAKIFFLAFAPKVKGEP